MIPLFLFLIVVCGVETGLLLWLWAERKEIKAFNRWLLMHVERPRDDRPQENKQEEIITAEPYTPEMLLDDNGEWDYMNDPDGWKYR